MDVDDYTFGSIYSDMDNEYVLLESVTDTLSFVRGYFDRFGNISDIHESDEPECTINLCSKRFQEFFLNTMNIPCKVDNYIITFTGTNCIDFLGKIYNTPSVKNENNEDKYETYIEWLVYQDYLTENLPECLVYKTDENAVIPTKAKESDAGYDLTVIKVAKKFLQNITLYDTGIKIKVNHGLYAEVVPRSSLSKSGYMLANSIGIIDRSYTGNIFIALVKVDPTAPDIELPFKCCQLIFRKQVHVNIKEVNQPFDETARGEGGFGSTGK